MVQILDGRALATRIREKIKTRVSVLSTPPGLAVILVGNDPASHTYVNIKQTACEEAGVHFEKYLFLAIESEQTLIDKIRELNARTDIHGILVQLPLPSQDPDRIIKEIDPNKDVDGFHPESLRRLKSGEPALVSAVALGVMRLIGEVRQKAIGRRQGVIISSPLFAEPLVHLLKEKHIQSKVIDSADPALKEKTKTADVLIVAVGKPRLITGEMIKSGATVIDVGTTRIDGKLVGDVDDASVKLIAGALTPVPGGVGPMTVAMLLVNVLKAYTLFQGGDHLEDNSANE